MRKRYSAAYKADVVKELLKEEKTVSQLASEIGVHPTQLKEWKKIVLQGLPELFERNGASADKQAKVQEQQVDELYAQIAPKGHPLALVEREAAELPVSVQAAP